MTTKDDVYRRACSALVEEGISEEIADVLVSAGFFNDWPAWLVCRLAKTNPRQLKLVYDGFKKNCLGARGPDESYIDPGWLALGVDPEELPGGIRVSGLTALPHLIKRLAPEVLRLAGERR